MKVGRHSILAAFAFVPCLATAAARAADGVVATVDVHVAEIDGCGLAHDIDVVLEAADGTRWTQRIMEFVAEPETEYGKPRTIGGWWDYDALCGTAPFDSVPTSAGTTTLRVFTTSPDWRIAPETWSFEDSPDEPSGTRHDIHVVLAHRHVIAGIVLDRDSREPVVGASLECAGELPRGPTLRAFPDLFAMRAASPTIVESLSTHWTTDRSGRFEFEWPTRDVTLRARSALSQPKLATVRVDPVTAASRSNATIVLVSDPLRAVLDVKALRENGTPARGATVELSVRTPADLPLERIDANSDVDALVDDWFARARGSSGASIADGPAPIVLDEQGCARIVVRVPGIIEVRVRGGDERAAMWVRVEPGATAKATLRLSSEDDVDACAESVLDPPRLVGGSVIGFQSREGIQALLQVRGPDGRWGVPTPSDSEGCFLVHAWPGSWLRARHEDSPERTIRWDHTSSSMKPIVIGTPTQERAFILHGTVRIPGTDRAAQGVLVEAIGADEVQSCVTWASPSGHDYEFGIESAAPIVLRADAGAWGAECLVDVRTADTRVDLELKPLAPVEIRVYDAIRGGEINDAAFDCERLCVDGRVCVMVPQGDVAYVLVSRAGYESATLAVDSRSNLYNSIMLARR